jgi:hypothetical protein
MLCVGTKYHFFPRHFLASSGIGLHKIPFVAVKIKEYNHPAVGFLSRFFGKLHVACFHEVVVIPEIVRSKEQEHPSPV